MLFFIFFEPQQYRVRPKMEIKHHAKFTVIKSFLTCNTIIIWEIPFEMNVMVLWERAFGVGIKTKYKCNKMYLFALALLVFVYNKFTRIAPQWRMIIWQSKNSSWQVSTFKLVLNIIQIKPNTKQKCKSDAIAIIWIQLPFHNSFQIAFINRKHKTFKDYFEHMLSVPLFSIRRPSIQLSYFAHLSRVLKCHDLQQNPCNLLLTEIILHTDKDFINVLSLWKHNRCCLHS